MSALIKELVDIAKWLHPSEEKRLDDKIAKLKREIAIADKKLEVKVLTTTLADKEARL